MIGQTGFADNWRQTKFQLFDFLTKCAGQLRPLADQVRVNAGFCLPRPHHLVKPLQRFRRQRLDPDQLDPLSLLQRAGESYLAQRLQGMLCNAYGGMLSCPHRCVAGEDKATRAALGIEYMAVKVPGCTQHRIDLPRVFVDADQQILGPHRGEPHHHQQAQSDAIRDRIGAAQGPVGGRSLPCGHSNCGPHNCKQDRGVNRHDGLAPPAESPEDGREVSEEGCQRQDRYQRARKHRNQQRGRGLVPELGHR